MILSSSRGRIRQPSNLGNPLLAVHSCKPLHNRRNKVIFCH
jgi:hypothetical protein